MEEIFQVLNKIKLKKLKWEDIPRTNLLYRGQQARQIKKAEGNNAEIIKNVFANGETDSSQGTECYPSYLSITEKIRLFGYQWKGKFKVVIIDLDHKMMKRK